jgi:hypothetical protein
MIFKNQGRFRVTTYYFNIDSGFLFYLLDDVAAVSRVPHSTRGAGAVMLYLVNLHHTTEDAHTSSEHFLPFLTYLTVGENVETQPQRYAQKIQLREFGLSFLYGLYFGNQQTRRVAADIYCCDDHVQK